MEKHTKQVIQAMLGHQIIYSNFYRERKDLLDIYRLIEAEQSANSNRPSGERYLILSLIIIGILVAAYLFTHLPSVTN
jgi:hypothetical protein